MDDTKLLTSKRSGDDQIFLDAHAKPPGGVRQVFKHIQKLTVLQIAHDADILDVGRASEDGATPLPGTSSAAFPIELSDVLADFLGSYCDRASNTCESQQPQAAFEITAVPGLTVYPSLFPPDVQLCMLDRLLHRDLTNPVHKTNIHMHHHVQYPERASAGQLGSFFNQAAASLEFQPKDPQMHKPVSNQQFLNKKLRWMTLGGQYDWTNKVYPYRPPPPFPPDLKKLVDSTFPTKAEAAIVNLYSPGDTLSLHRDVSEECIQPLVSISLGCEALFVIGLDAEYEHAKPPCVTIRLRSGDAVLMSGESRYAWHGVPKVLTGTCPEWMADWPGELYPGWKGWMRGKRINLNVRQMFEHSHDSGQNSPSRVPISKDFRRLASFQQRPEKQVAIVR